MQLSYIINVKVTLTNVKDINTNVIASEMKWSEAISYNYMGLPRRPDVTSGLLAMTDRKYMKKNYPALIIPTITLFVYGLTTDVEIKLFVYYLFRFYIL